MDLNTVKVSKSKHYRDVQKDVQKELQEISPNCSTSSSKTEISDKETESEQSILMPISSSESNDANADLFSNNDMVEDLSLSAISDISSPLQSVMEHAETSCPNNDTHDDPNLKQSIVQWALDFNVSHAALNKLLNILQPYVKDLPKDARTILHTERKSKVLINNESEKYLYLGLKNGIINKLDSGVSSNTLTLKFNIDGLPINNEGSSHFWPIQCVISESTDKNPFIVSVYHGVGKPTSLEDFLMPFVNEMQSLIETGISHNSQQYTVSVDNCFFVCDAPARAFVKCVKQHNAYFSCDKCELEGVYYKNRMTYLDLNCNKRTDFGFINREQPEHHHNEQTSPLEQLPIGMVSQFPIDYMHQVCLGCVKRIISFWTTGKNFNVRLSSVGIKHLEKILINLRKHIPKEFNRKLSDFSKYKRWKATEFRLFLVYIGPVALRKILKVDVYKNFMLLSCGIYILLSSDNPDLVNYASSLLRTFVEESTSLYGKHFVVYNVHSLIHLADDVLKFGKLDNFSSFPFENNMKTIKRMLRAENKPLEQLSRRISEKSYVLKSKNESCSIVQAESNFPKLLKIHDNGPITTHSIKCQYSEMKLETAVFTTKPPNNCCYIDINVVAIIENILESNKKDIFLIVKTFEILEDLYDYPCKSSMLNVYRVSKLSKEYKTYKFNNKIKKMFLLPINSKKYAAIPLAHNISFKP